MGCFFNSPTTKDEKKNSHTAANAVTRFGRIYSLTRFGTASPPLLDVPHVAFVAHVGVRDERAALAAALLPG